MRFSAKRIHRRALPRSSFLDRNCLVGVFCFLVGHHKASISRGCPSSGGRADASHVGIALQCTPS